MGIRKISNTGTRKNIGKFPSLKLNRPVWWESLIERDFLYLLEFDPGVIFYKEQPFRIHYTLNGKRYFYTPDLFVQRKDKRQVIEVKPENKLLKEAFIILCRIISVICREHGYEFVVITDAKIRVQPQLDNIKLLWRYARVPIYLQHRLYCQEFFKTISGSNSPRLGELILFFSSKGFGREVVYALLYWGWILTDLMVPLDEASIVRPLNDTRL